MKIKLFGRTWEFKNATTTTPALGNDSAWASYLAGKGYPVSANTAIKISAVIRCVDVVAKTMASLPFHLMQETENGLVKAKTHIVHQLLSKLPNPYTTAYEFWHMYVVNLMLTRGAFAKIVRDRNRYITEIWNIPTANVSTFYNNTVSGERYIIVNLGNGKTETLRDGDYMYTPGLRFGSDIDPENPILLASNVLGLTMALNGFAQDYFENGSNLGGFVEYPNTVPEEQYKNFKDSWHETYAGVTNQHKIAFLESGFKFNQLTSKPSDAQALESRKFQIIEICRMLGVPPHKVFDLERATFSNIEQQNIEYVQESITPMSVRIEQTIYKDVLTSKERTIYKPQFNVNGLMRGDLSTRAEYYHNARNDGWMSANDIRSLEDMNLIPEDQGGNVYAVNGNMIPLTAVPMNLPKGATNNAQNKVLELQGQK